jgi:hypothetical protein
MPSELTQSVRTAINSFVSLKTSDDHGEIAIDVLRAIRAEADLLMERQTIFDAFDSDTLNFFDGDIQLINQVERLKVINLLDCSILNFLCKYPLNPFIVLHCLTF